MSKTEHQTTPHQDTQQQVRATIAAAALVAEVEPDAPEPDAPEPATPDPATPEPATPEPTRSVLLGQSPPAERSNPRQAALRNPKDDADPTKRWVNSGKSFGHYQHVTANPCDQPGR